MKNKIKQLKLKIVVSFNSNKTNFFEHVLIAATVYSSYYYFFNFSKLFNSSLYFLNSSSS